MKHKNNTFIKLHSLKTNKIIVLSKDVILVVLPLEAIYIKGVLDCPPRTRIDLKINTGGCVLVRETSEQIYNKLR